LSVSARATNDTCRLQTRQPIQNSVEMNCAAETAAKNFDLTANIPIETNFRQ
jgi:hypothetical protein